MRRSARILGTILILAGLSLLGWAVVVWQWEDPFTSAYTALEQRRLEDEWDRRLAQVASPATYATWAEEAAAAPTPAAIARAARAYRASLRRGDVVGRLRVPRLDLDVLIVDGTDPETLKRGPGRHQRTFVPGERRLVYVAGHRTTYGAPFSGIDRLRPGDEVFVEMPYGTFEYRVVGHRIVEAADLSVLRSREREEIALQACHPRFFASQRYIAYAEPVGVTARNGASVGLAAAS